jgi:two-component system response regulator BaeR
MRRSSLLIAFVVIHQLDNVESFVAECRDFTTEQCDIASVLAMTEKPTMILIVEDELKLARVLEDYLRASGFATRIIEQGDEAVAAVHQFAPALVLLDLMLPGLDGLEVCRQVRAFTQIPIIMITARIEEVDRLLGLELGADDYICKPFQPREVIARVKAQLRRVAWARQLVDQPSVVHGLTLDADCYEASLHGRRLQLTPVEFRLLSALLNQEGRVLSRDQLMRQAYTDDRIVCDRAVDTHIKNIRKKLQAEDPKADYIYSVYGVGYKFVVMDDLG